MADGNDFNDDKDQRAIHGILLEQVYYREGVSDDLAANILKEIRTVRRAGSTPWMLYALIAAAASIALVVWIEASRMRPVEPTQVTVPHQGKPAEPVVVERPKPSPVETPEPVVVEKPKPSPVETPEPVVVERPKQSLVETPEPVVIEKPDPIVPKVPEQPLVPVRQQVVAVAMTDGLAVLRDERIALKRGGEVLADDRLVAIRAARVKFKDGSIIEFDAGALIVFWRPKTGDRTDIELLRGKARATVVMGQSRFLVDAGATIASFGGDFTVEKSARKTRIAVKKGAVATTSGGTTIRVAAGQFASIAGGKPPVLVSPPTVVQQKPAPKPKADIFAGIPVAVANAARRRFNRGDITSIEKEIEGHSYVYTIKARPGNNATELKVASNGKVIDRNRYAGLPVAVANTLKRRFPGMDVTKIEKEKKKRTYIYKIKGKSGRKDVEIKIASDGKIVEGGEKKKKKDDDDDEHENKKDDD